MYFGFQNLKAWLVAGLVVAVMPQVRAQSAGPGQQIIFTAPGGETVSNVLPPAVQAPGSREAANLPAAPETRLSLQSYDPVTPIRPPVYVWPNKRQKTPNDGRRPRLLTPAQIMGVQSIEDIFGLSESDYLGAGTNQATAGRGDTNYIYSGESSSSDDPTWAKILSDYEGQSGSGSNSNNAGISQSMVNGFFNGVPRHGFFDGHDNKNSDESAFAPVSAMQTSDFQSEFNPFTKQAAALPGPAFPQTSPSFDSAFNPGSGSPSSFAIPRTSPETLPQLPALPAAPHQNYDYTPPASPSWEPKPAPWLSPVPPMGSMAQRKF